MTPPSSTCLKSIQSISLPDNGLHDYRSHRCTPEALTSGSCLPGKYVLRYSVLGAEAYLEVHVERQSSVTLSYRLPTVM